MRPPLEDLMKAIEVNKTIWQVSILFGVSTATIKNWLKVSGIKSPEGFYSRGLKAGRKPGFHYDDATLAEMSKRAKGEKNPFFGKKHTEEAIAKMRADRKDITGDNNPFKKSLEKPGKREEHSARCKKIWSNRDINWRIKFSNTLSCRPISECKNSKRHETGLYISNKCNAFHFRSSWEYAVACALDYCESITGYEYESIQIPYRDLSDSIRHTITDFFVTFRNGNQAVLEVKPSKLIASSLFKLLAQYEYAISNGFQFRVLTKECIFDTIKLQSILCGLSQGYLIDALPEDCGINS